MKGRISFDSISISLQLRKLLDLEVYRFPPEGRRSFKRKRGKGRKKVRERKGEKKRKRIPMVGFTTDLSGATLRQNEYRVPLRHDNITCDRESCKTGGDS
jgi:hypothetical protein